MQLTSQLKPCCSINMHCHEMNYARFPADYSALCVWLSLERQMQMRRLDPEIQLCHRDFPFVVVIHPYTYKYIYTDLYIWIYVSCSAVCLRHMQIGSTLSQRLIWTQWAAHPLVNVCAHIRYMYASRYVYDSELCWKQFNSFAHAKSATIKSSCQAISIAAIPWDEPQKNVGQLKKLLRQTATASTRNKVTRECKEICWLSGGLSRDMFILKYFLNLFIISSEYTSKGNRLVLPERRAQVY